MRKKVQLKEGQTFHGCILFVGGQLYIDITPKTNMSPKKGPFPKETSSSNHRLYHITYVYQKHGKLEFLIFRNISRNGEDFFQLPFMSSTKTSGEKPASLQEIPVFFSCDFTGLWKKIIRKNTKIWSTSGKRKVLQLVYLKERVCHKLHSPKPTHVVLLTLEFQ